MLNPEINLSHKIFSGDAEEEALRDGYGKGLVEAGENRNVVALTADLEESTRCHFFKKVYPDRFFEVGVAEQNMIAIAAGLGISGKIPFVNSYAVFSPGGNWQEIRTVVAYNDSNVKIVGHHAGLLTGPDGATHQCLEDIALMRSLPNMKVIVPCDAEEARKATLAAAKIWGPVYIRLAREKTPVITTKETPFVVGKSRIFYLSQKNKPKVLIVSAGPITGNALPGRQRIGQGRNRVGGSQFRHHQAARREGDNFLGEEGRGGGDGGGTQRYRRFGLRRRRTALPGMPDAG